MWECGVKNSLCLPHARGGVSLMHGVGYEPLQSSPRTWGCFYPISVFCKLHHVFPTHVGVFLLMLTFRGLRMSLPHARGGVSVVNYGNTLDRKSSPRTWGCFRCMPPILRKHYVFPTHVGVFPLYAPHPSQALRLPHARGGVSDDNFAYFAALASSPRTWGCFFLFFLTISAALVFPTHVGVFLRVDDNNAWRAGLPHARGGVSLLRMTRGNGLSSSPRTWGCFSMASCW